MRTELSESAHAWEALVKRFPAGQRPRLTDWAWLDYHLLLRPAPAVVDDPPVKRARRRPPAADRRSSILGRLAHGDDPLALRLFLTLLVVDYVTTQRGCPEVFSTIPIIERRARNEGAKKRVGRVDQARVTWATLTVVGSDDPALRSTRMNRALKRLSGEGLVTVERSTTRLGREVRLQPQDFTSTVEPVDGMRRVGLPLDFWSKGWCAILTGDEIVNLLMLLSLRELVVYEEVVPGAPRRLGPALTTKRPRDVKPIRMEHPNKPGTRIEAIPAGSHLLVPTPQRAVVAARSLREDTFGVHQARYQATSDLRQFGILNLEVSATTPDITEKNPNRRSSGSAVAFSINFERMSDSAPEAMEEALKAYEIPWKAPFEYHPKVIEAIDRRRAAEYAYEVANREQSDPDTVT